ncbi:hypothetical protein O3P69_009337 [Scylla paramamosain]|uniref:Uncharacterized protein n=1 Tax=Scylla paramamosain TaxID=85552 RepID=A0AAW0TAZ9_SCYPA
MGLTPAVTYLPMCEYLVQLMDGDKKTHLFSHREPIPFAYCFHPLVYPNLAMGWASLALGLLVLVSVSYQQASGKTCKEAGGQCLGDKRAQICSQYLDSSLSCEEGKVCCTRKVCRTGKKCKKAHGVCQSLYDKCKGKTLKGGCNDDDCVCCVPKPQCKTKKHCMKKKGVCQPKKNPCKGKVSKKGCAGKGCVCCYKKKKKCTLTPECYEVHGKCQKKNKPCHGWILFNGCKGKHCVCCYVNGLFFALSLY